jgi:hypothetical protein
MSEYGKTTHWICHGDKTNHTYVILDCVCKKKGHFVGTMMLNHWIWGHRIFTQNRNLYLAVPNKMIVCPC